MAIVKDFGSWDSSIHEHYEQAKRISTGKRDLTPSTLNQDTATAEFVGSGSNVYVTTLDSCTCGDFMKRKLPCKHIYALANALGYIGDLPALSKAAEFDVSAEISRYCSLYMNGAISVEKFSRISEALSKGK